MRTGCRLVRASFGGAEAWLLESWEQHIVFEMHVRYDIVGEFPQSGIERRPGAAGTLGQRHAMGGMLDILKKPGRIPVLVAHPGDRLRDACIRALPHPGEDDLFLAPHMIFQVFLQRDQRLRQP